MKYDIQAIEKRLQELSSSKEEAIHTALVQVGITPEYIAKKMKSLLESNDERIVLYAIRLWMELEGLWKRFEQPIIPIQINQYIEKAKVKLGLDKMTDKEVMELAEQRGVRIPSYIANTK